MLYYNMLVSKVAPRSRSVTGASSVPRSGAARAAFLQATSISCGAS